MPSYLFSIIRMFKLLVAFTPRRYFFTIYLLLVTARAIGQGKDVVQFTHLTTANGLSQSSVVCILKDKYGFMWFGTQDGLNKYDGYKFKVYRNTPADKRSIPNNNIRCMLEDHAGNLWVGTVGGGLALYDRKTDSFMPISASGGDEKIGAKIIKSIFEDREHNLWVGTVSGFNMFNPKTKKLVPHVFQYVQLDNINCIYEDSKDNLWIGTLFGLNKWNKHSNSFKHYATDAAVPGSLSASTVNTVYEDAGGKLWIGTVNGLNLYDDKTDSFRIYRKDTGKPTALKDNVIRALCDAGGGKLWVATELALELFDPNANTFTHYQQSLKDVRSLSSSSISSLLVDDQGILWVGTYAKGINKYDRNQFKFNLYKNFGTDALNINANIVTSFSEMPDGDIWVGTDGSGLYRWTPHTNKFEAFNPASKENYFSSLAVLCMKMSRKKDYLWVGTYDAGVAKINLTTHQRSYYRASSDSHSLNNQSVYALLEDKKGNIWIGTNGGGVNVLNPATNQFSHIELKVGKHKNSANYIRALYEDMVGNIWIGTVAHGVIVYNPVTGQYHSYSKAADNLGSDAVFSIFGDSKGNIWVGTMGGGLCLFNPAHNNFTRFTESDGLANNIVNSIVEDKFGCLWLSTDNGISCFDPVKKTFKNYTSSSGLQSNEFSIGAGYRLSDGQIAFGGLEGFNIFMPGSLKDNPNIPPVVITDFQLFNKPLLITPDKQPLSQNINTNREITLAYDQSVFTIEYAALGYTVPERNLYAYMLEGFDTGWNYVGTERKTTYTNLDPGTYTFRVKASNNDGLWNEAGTSLKIVIMPPFWKTTWAYMVYIAAVAAMLYLLYREVESREKLKSEVHYQKLLTEKTKELNQLKLDFFTNLSHELRTPLSLIVDPLRKIKNEHITVAQAKKYSGLVFDNASMLMNLVNQLLDFRKAETGGFSLDAGKTDVIALVKKVFHAFTDRAKERNINYYLDLKIDQLDAWIDTSKLEKILYNLIPNAFKYTPDFGLIMIMVKRGVMAMPDGEQKNAFEIHIKDSGVGIPDELKSKIFDIFYQIKGSSRFENESSGIGLALTRELVLLHKGEILVADAENQGTDFIVRLPVGEEHFENDELQAETQASPEPETLVINGNKVPDDKVSSTPIVLLVEDNQGLREYIADELEGAYHVEQAVNGIEGLKKAVDFIPDIIISDIMMPEGDGLELCSKLKADEKTSHIPIILLTAKQNDDNKIEGYNAGADDYIAKPFNVTLLAARISNILESRKKLRERFSTHTGVSIEESAIPDIDKEFLKKVVQIIEDNLSYLNFDIDKLATALKMSRRQLYRKLNALTNQTAHDFITNTRLEHAAALLLTGEFTISEIGYKVGFSEPSNFSRSFTKKFGKSPKKYLSDLKVI